MARISANGKIYLLLPMIFMGLSSMVGAVDITFYSDSTACTGSGYSFNGISGQVCCIADGGSVLFTDMDGCKTSVVYRNGGCDSNAVGSGTGNICYVGGGFTSGYWYQSCRRRSLLADVPFETPKCDGKSKPNGIVFTEDPHKGSWMLKGPDAVEHFSYLESLPHEGKVNWLKSKGAVFHPSSGNVKTIY